MAGTSRKTPKVGLKKELGGTPGFPRRTWGSAQWHRRNCGFHTNPPLCRRRVGFEKWQTVLKQNKNKEELNSAAPLSCVICPLLFDGIPTGFCHCTLSVTDGCRFLRHGHWVLSRRSFFPSSLSKTGLVQLFTIVWISSTLCLVLCRHCSKSYIISRTSWMCSQIPNTLDLLVGVFIINQKSGLSRHFKPDVRKGSFEVRCEEQHAKHLLLCSLEEKQNHDGEPQQRFSSASASLASISVSWLWISASLARFSVVPAGCELQIGHSGSLLE